MELRRLGLCDQRADLLLGQPPLRGERGEVGAACGARLLERGGGRPGLLCRACERRPAAGERTPGRDDVRARRFQLTEDVLALAARAAEVVEVRECLVQALRSEHDLQRLDVALFVESTKARAESPLRNRGAAARDRELQSKARLFGPQGDCFILQRRELRLRSTQLLVE